MTARLLRYGGLISVGIIAVPVVLYCFVIDRIPPYLDEAFFSYTALKLVTAGTMAWRISCNAPYWQQVWGYYGPLYPLAQAGVFHLLNVSWFSVRFLNLIAGNGAVALLCVALHRWGWRAPAVALSLAWVGDRALRETAIGRPEGLALLMLVVALVLLVSTLRRGPGWRLAVAMMALGLGVGLQPTMVLTCAAILALLLYLEPNRRRTLGYALAGFGVPFLMVAVLYRTTWREAIAQFRWHVAFELSNHPVPRIRWFDWSLGWSQTEVYLTVLGLVLIVVPAVIQIIRRHAESREGWTRDESILFVTGALAVSTLCSRPPQSLHAYHLVLLAPLAILSTLGVARIGSGRLRLAARGWLVLLALAWVPSLAQNVVELRGPFAEYAALDPGRMPQDFESLLPPHAAVDVDYNYFVPAYQAGLSFDVLPWFPCAVQYDDERWLILPLDEWQAQQQQFEGRWSEVLERYGPSQWFREQYVIVAPRIHR